MLASILQAASPELLITMLCYARNSGALPRKKIAKTFPSFDERIGWSIHGAYDDEGLPVEVEERLSAFFRPHDDAFFEILGRRFAWRT